jgi:hypothetical protein
VKRGKLLTIVAAVIIIIIVIAAAYTVLGQKKSTTYNVVQVYVTSWNLDINDTTPVDVRFRILLDLDGNGVFEVNKTSETFTGVTFQIAPFNLGGPINSAVQKFYFLVEVEKATGASWVNMRYQNNDTTPINEGKNEVDVEGSWSYESTMGDPGMDCAITYAYYVS